MTTQALSRFSLRSPGTSGLYTDGESAGFDPNKALVLENAVFDTEGKIAARQGYAIQGSTHGEDPITIFQINDEGGIPVIIHSTASDIYEGSAGATSTYFSVDGTAGGGNYQFAAFGDKVIGAKSGTGLLVSYQPGASNFAPITASGGTVPNGDCVISTHGRVWATDWTTRMRVSWSGLNTETDWSGGGAGSIDFRDLLPEKAGDLIIGLTEFQNRLIVFFKRHIAVCTGLDDPASLLEVEDIISNVGAASASRDAITNIGNDVIFLAHDGVLRSLTRSLAANDRIPMTDLSLNVSTAIADTYEGFFTEDFPYIKADYSRDHSFYFLQIAGHIWVFDTKRPNPDGSLRVSRWFMNTTSVYEDANGNLWLGINGGLARYRDYLDGADTYQFRYDSTWFEILDGRGVLPKTMTVTTLSGGTYTVAMTTAFDFDLARAFNQNFSVVGGQGTEWGIGEWNLGEWSGAVSRVARTRIMIGGEGERMQISLRVQINGQPFGLHSIDIVSKRGRLAA